MQLPECELSNVDGNVFCLIAAVQATLTEAGQKRRMKEFTKKAYKSKSYDEVLDLIADYVDVF